MSDVFVEGQNALIPRQVVLPSPETISKIINRLRALTLKLLPLQVSPSEINDPTSRIITPAVITAYSKAAGDFHEALPYCLIRAHHTFVWDADHNPADYDENMGRATACEMLARRVLRLVPPDRLDNVMSARFKYVDWDGDPSSPKSALEEAIDQHCTIFLSSSEVQHVVNSLWRGDWIQRSTAIEEVNYVAYDESTAHRGPFGFLDPTRLSVPRYQNWFRILVWVFFLIIYSQSVQQPTEHQAPHDSLDVWEILLYTFAIAFSMEDLFRLYKTLRYFTWKAFTFWTCVSLTTDALLLTTITYRVLGFVTDLDKGAADHKLKSFQILSTVSPLIWMKLITVVDGFKYVGTMQICVSRMLQESTLFFGLLSILGIGFAQAMFALDASDGRTEEGHHYTIMNALIQALLQAPNFERPAENPIGLTLYYLWNVATTVILLNILVSLFASAYSDVTEDAEAEFLAFFAEKTVGMIRAPDEYVYVAPFNLIEVFFVAPFEVALSSKTYARLNRTFMIMIFFIPLTLIALFESQLDTKKNKFFRSLFSAADEGEEDDPTRQDPQIDEDDEDGKRIVKVRFHELVKGFPDTTQSAESTIIKEIHALQRKVEELLAQSKAQ